MRFRGAASERAKENPAAWALLRAQHDTAPGTSLESNTPKPFPPYRGRKLAAGVPAFHRGTRRRTDCAIPHTGRRHVHPHFLTERDTK